MTPAGGKKPRRGMPAASGSMVFYCVFGGGANFSSAFRRCEGMTPLGYRRLMNKMGNKSSTAYLHGLPDMV